MSTDLFHVQTRISPCQHIRQYARATSTHQEETFQMEVKQYTPRDNLHPKPGDLTIVTAHALGFPKEVYEPLFDDLLHCLHGSDWGLRIRSIWIADIATHGASAKLNEGKLGNDPSLYDWARDILLMINHFRDEMPRPLAGIGHSMGGNTIINVALMHPRLFTTVILIEPIVNRHYRGMNYSPIHAIAFKRDQWPSRKAAMAWAQKHSFYKAFDKRVLERYIEHGLRELPTLLYPEDPQPTMQGKPVTLATTRDHDVSAFARGAYPKPGQPLSEFEIDKKTHPDLSRAQYPLLGAPFYRPEAVMTFAQLPFLRPSCLYIYGNQSTFSSGTPMAQQDKLSITGTAVGGSGGHAEGAVQNVILEGTGHFSAFEKPTDVAQAVAPWLRNKLKKWAEMEKDPEWEAKDIKKRSMLDDAWLYWAKVHCIPEKMVEYEGDAVKAKL